MFYIPWINKCDKCDFELISSDPPNFCPECIKNLYIKMGIGEMQYLRHRTDEELKNAND